MLTPEQTQGLEVAFELLAEPITEYLIRDIARRVAEAGQFTSTAAYEIWRLQELGKSRDEIEKAVSQILDKEIPEVQSLFRQAAEVGYDFDISRLSRDAVPFADNTSVQQIVDAAVKLAGEDLRNITQTMGFQTPDGVTAPLLEAYLHAADEAFNLIISGAADYNTAIRRACTKLASEGIQSIDYASGVHTSLEAAIRRDMMGGLGLMTEQISQQNHDDLGADGWEISAHAASAPDHEPIQGRQYSDEAYQQLNASLHRRIGTLNCGHNAFPIILGVNAPQYTSEELEKFRRDNQKGVDYEGRHFDTVYEATQYQRQIERAVRKQKNRILVDEAAGNEEKLTADQIKLRRLNQEYRRFCQATGLRSEAERLRVSGFGRGQTVKTKSSKKTGIENSKQFDILNEEEAYAVYQYKSAKSYQINAALRGEIAVSADLEPVIHSIDNALEKLPIYEGTVYRSMRSEEMLDSVAFFKMHTPGNVVKYPAYTSSSTEVYDESMDIQLIIRSKRGRDMRVYNSLEQEILFKRGSRFLVEKREGKRIWLKEI